jgi:antitoxin component of RelBE/YafQ-DinJ toxin-antitoxin module
MPQINTRLSQEIRQQFDKYAAEVGLDASELARLLIIRAMRRGKRLRPPLQIPKVYGQPATLRKLTAHFHRSQEIEEFDRFALTRGLPRAAAARSIFEAELEERWLAHAMLWVPRRRRGI